ncbi:MAG: phosphatidate cytidylyltransferase [Phycisphaerales bacterium]|nr:phosphatidate cytidylyltransferase [Phycisphaerales bacterium]
MTSRLLDKLFSPSEAFDQPATVGMLIGIGIALLIVPLVVEGLGRTGRMSPPLRTEIYVRYVSWLVIIPAMLAPVLLGPGATILAIGALSLLCYREFARATGCFRHRAISAVVALGIVALTFASLDHWYNFFVALPSLTISLIAIVALARDEPRGYIQRVALGVLSFILFGVCFGHLGYMANDQDYRPIIILIVLCVEANDVFAFVAGKAFGRRRLAPATSPSKTVGGSIGAIGLTSGLFATIGHFVFRGTVLDAPVHLLTMGVMLSVVGQFGDLVISSVKRDLGIKDMGSLIPGHGGLLDRFDSVVLVAPAMFHYIGYFRGIGLDQPTRLFTGDAGG